MKKAFQISFLSIGLSHNAFGQTPQPIEWGSFLMEEGGEVYFPTESSLSRPMPLEASVNSITTPIAQRLDIYLGYLKNLVGVPTNLNIGFSKEAFGINKQQMQTSSWPSLIPLSISRLNTKERALTIFVVKTSQRVAYLEKIDFWWFDGKGALRSYWSRELNDPQKKEPAASALRRIAQHMQRNRQTPNLAPPNSGCFIFTQKNISDKDISWVESAARGINPNVGALAPIGVNGLGFTWSVPLGPTDCLNLMKRCKTELPHVNVNPDSQGFSMAKKP